jgi:hypothetical protein
MAVPIKSLGVMVLWPKVVSIEESRQVFS